MRIRFENGSYETTDLVTITPPPNGGLLRFNPSTGFPEQMSVSSDMMGLLQCSDWAAMKSAAGLVDTSSFTWGNLNGKPSFATVATSGSYNDLSNKPTINSRVFTTPTFSGATTANILHATRDTEVSYDFDATVTISLLAGQSVTATLRYADNSGMSTNVVTVSSQVASNSGVLNLTQANTLKLSGVIPAGKYRQVTFSATGSGATAPTTLKAGQEVTLP